MKNEKRQVLEGLMYNGRQKKKTAVCKEIPLLGDGGGGGGWEQRQKTFFQFFFSLIFFF